MTKRQDRIERMARIDSEFQAAAIAADLLGERLREDPSFGSPSLRARDGEAMRQNIESVFIVRLFAEFEAGLREAWADALSRSTVPRMKDLVDAYTARRKIPVDIADAVHRVREYRNSLLHGGEAAPVSMQNARQQLNRFFARLPENW